MMTESQMAEGNGRTAAAAAEAERARERGAKPPAAGEPPMRLQDPVVAEPLDMELDEEPPKGHWWTKLIVFAVLGGLAFAGWHYWPKINAYLNAKPAAGGPGGARGKGDVPVVAAKSRRGNLDLYLNGLGTVTPFNTVTVKTRVDGQIMKVLFHEGQSVNEGDPLIEIDRRPYQVQLTQAQGQWARDKALLDNAKLDLKKYEEAGAAAVGQQQIDTAKATVEQYEGTLKSDQGQIDNANLQIVYCHITAPLSGRIGLRMVDEGNMVHASDQNGLAVITQLKPIAVVFTIPQDSISRLMEKPDGGEGLRVEAWNRDITKKLAQGTVVAIDNEVDPATGTIRIKASFPNEKNELFPSQFVNARLLVETVKEAVIVPAAAVQRGPTFDFVYVVKPDNTVELRKVTLGPVEGDQTVIEEGTKPGEGVKAGEMVVTDGVDRLTKGAKVVVREAGAKRGAATKPATQPATTAPNPKP
jgi:multidrug efflux system membrane fusion protein